VLRHKSQPKVVLDLAAVPLIDHTVMHTLHNLQAEMEENGSQLTIVGMDHLHGVTTHPHSDHRIGSPKLATRLRPLQTQWSKAARAMHLPVVFDQPIAPEWSGFEFLRGESLDIQHALITVSNRPRFLVADFGVRSGALLTETMETMTLMLIEVPSHLHIPDFVLETETNMHRLFDELTGLDIDFADFPRFSATFRLRGDDQLAIRRFFTPKRLELLEEFDDYEIESKEGFLLIRHQKRRVTPRQLEGMIRFGKLVANMIESKPSSFPYQAVI
jgi:hypothetical protein